MNNSQISLDNTYTDSLNAKADLTFVNSNISKKANIVDVYTKVESDITTANLTNNINTKAKIIDVYNNNESDTKSSNTNTLIYNAIVLKSNSSDVYTKTQSDATLTSNNTTFNNAINLKANIANPTFTGTVYGINKSMVGSVSYTHLTLPTNREV